MHRFLLPVLIMLAAHAPARAQTKPAVRTVENAGLLFTDNPAGVSGTDAGYSIPLPKQTLWLFGDVFLLDTNAPKQSFAGAVSNCGLLTGQGSGPEPLKHYTFLTDPKTGLARQLLSPATTEGTGSRFWPFGGWYRSRDKRVYLYYASVQNTGSGPLDFHIEGNGLASCDAADPAAMQFTRLPAAPGQPLWWSGEGDGPRFGSAVISDAPGDFLYIVGEQSVSGNKRGKLARVPKDRIADLSAYTYFAGGTETPQWSAALADAADVDGLTDFPSELSVAYNAYLGGWLAVHTIGLSEKVRLSLAPHPWGPYRRFAEIGTPKRAFSSAFCYAGKEHPELAEQHGRVIYVTYVDSGRYWLHLLKVTLQK